MGDLDGKVAVVTGGSSGIGKATAILMAEQGARVVVAARREKEGTETADGIRDAGGEATFVQADVSIEGDIKRVMDTAVETYGSIDCAFNNAGRTEHSTIPWDERDVELWDAIDGVNLRGYWLCMKYELAQMLKNGGGAIVNNSSIAGLTALPGEIYTATKHGVIGMSKTAAVNYGNRGIRVNVVCPGVIETPIISGLSDDGRDDFIKKVPLGRLGTDTEIAEPVVWLCSDKASYVTGTTLTVDGGVMEGMTNGWRPR